MSLNTKHLVLVVEDDESFSNHILNIIKIAVPDFEYRAARSIGEASKALKHRSVHGRLKVLLLDIMLAQDKKSRKQAERFSKEREEIARKLRSNPGSPVSGREALEALRQERFDVDQRLEASVNINAGVEFLKVICKDAAWVKGESKGTVIVVSGRDLSPPEVRNALKDAVGNLELHMLQKPPNPGLIINHLRNALEM